MKYLIYISNALHAMSEDELEDVLKKSRFNNLKHQVTGVLLYFEGKIIQVLEGAPEDVDLIFEKIAGDVRHKNVLKIADKPLTERNFPDWTMGYSSIKGEFGDPLLGFIQFEEVADNPGDHRAINTLKTFIATHSILVTC